MNKPKDLESEIDDILSEFLENTAEALDETDFHRRIAASDEAIKEAKEAIKQLLQDAQREARIDGFRAGQQDIIQHYHHDPQIRLEVKKATRKATMKETLNDT